MRCAPCVPRLLCRYESLSEKLRSDPSGAMHGLWNRCMRLHMVFRPRRVNAKKKDKVALPLSFAELLDSPPSRARFEEYRSAQPEGGQKIIVGKQRCCCCCCCCCCWWWW